MPTIKVVFNGTPNRTYTYTAPEGEWAPDDLAVVDSPSSGFTLTTVTEVLPGELPGNKHVVGMVSLQAHKLRLAAEARKKEIIAQLERAEKALKEADRFAHLRADPALAELIAELGQL
jgi:hypothetical protein